MRILQKFRNGINLISNLFWLLPKKKSQCPKRVYFDLQESRLIPYYFSIFYAFLEAGYNVVLKVNWKFISGFYGYDKQLLRFTNFTCTIRLPGGKVFGFHDDAKAYNICNSALIYLNPKGLLDRTGLATRVPISMHPSMYLSENSLYSESLRDTPEIIRVLFSGNSYRLAYDNKNIELTYGMPNRYAILSAIEQMMDKDKLMLVDSFDQWDRISNEGYINKVVLLKWQWSKTFQEHSDLRIPNTQWLPTLAKAHFFLACPGVVTPQSHNIIEAMSVGCIPILSYKDLFCPSLEHKKNCIYYKNEHDLVVQLNDVLGFTESEISNMSMEVVKYYDQYLKPSSIVRQLERASSDLPVYFYNEVYC